MIRLLIFSIGSFIVFSIFHFVGKKKKPCKRALVSILCGQLVLILVNVLSNYTNVLVPLSELSFMTSIAGGIPGVTLLILTSVLL